MNKMKEILYTIITNILFIGGYILFEYTRKKAGKDKGEKDKKRVRKKKEKRIG